MTASERIREAREAMACANCGEPIREVVLSDGQSVWDHPTHGHHTVCDWYEGMEPTSRVATP